MNTLNDYTKYYTPLELAISLVSKLNLSDNSNIVDICCGSGNLLKAALQQNNTCRCYGVDLNKHTIEGCTTYQSDGRDFALNHSEAYDYALGNPPFKAIINSPYSDKLFDEEYKAIHIKRIEVEMLLANLQIIRKGGRLLIILPVTFVIGEKFLSLRQALTISNTIEQIIYLPHNAFFPETINCCALIIKKEKNTLNVSTQVCKMDEKCTIYSSYNISSTYIITGRWNGIEAQKTPRFLIKRGNISSSQFTENGEILVLHSSKKTQPWNPSIKHVSNNNILSNGTMANNGDIIISRVGKSAGSKCIYRGTPAYISDQLMMVECNDKEIVKKIMNMDLSSIKKGLSVTYITMGDIYTLYYNLYEREQSIDML